MTDVPESLRDRRYRVLGTLGEGAQATTFDAVDTKSGRAVAVKRFRVHGAKSWKEVELAEREAAVLARISHPLLPRYVEHFEERGELFLVTEKIEGESLSSLRRRGVAFDEGDVRCLIRDAASALGYLHGRTPPIVHRDLKPSNVIRRPDGSFAFIDFGAVRDRMKPEGGSTVVGTFGYMAPEQFQGRAMPASDVYSIGATALALLTGREPEDLPHRGLGIDVPAALEGFRVRPDLVKTLSAMLKPAPDERLQVITPLESAAPAKARSPGRAGQARGEAPRQRPRKRSAKGEARCPNPACDRGLVGDDVCPVCRGSGEAEPAPERRRKTANLEVAPTEAPCPNPGCDRGLVGGDVCPVCGGSGEAEPAPQKKRVAEETPSARRPRAGFPWLPLLFGVVAYGAQTLWDPGGLAHVALGFTVLLAILGFLGGLRRYDADRGEEEDVRRLRIAPVETTGGEEDEDEEEDEEATGEARKMRR